MIKDIGGATLTGWFGVWLGSQIWFVLVTGCNIRAVSPLLLFYLLMGNFIEATQTYVTNSQSNPVLYLVSLVLLVLTGLFLIRENADPDVFRPEEHWIAIMSSVVISVVGLAINITADLHGSFNGMLDSIDFAVGLWFCCGVLAQYLCDYTRKEGHVMWKTQWAMLCLYPAIRIGLDIAGMNLISLFPWILSMFLISFRIMHLFFFEPTIARATFSNRLIGHGGEQDVFGIDNEEGSYEMMEISQQPPTQSSDINQTQVFEEAG